jgi:tape measure domain-containing protein
MANNFNFTAKMGLDTSGFRAGVQQVKGSVHELKGALLSLGTALGAGFGFTALVSNLKETATQLSVAMNTLKNVSYETKYFKDGVKDVSIEITNFTDNLAFVKKLSKDYSQDLVAVTDNFAKFTAASKKTNLTLENQKFVFESLTKAAAYYHLSADRTSDMMNAVTQMMSKGKVAAEELRRQLGNTLPGAFNLMAAAMGVSNKKLEDMMRNGEVVSEEVLPKFAAMLNSVTKTAEFDSLQAAMNQLKNAWYEFVESSGAENLFKGLTNGLTSVISFVSENINGIKSMFWGLVAYFASMNIYSSFIKNGNEWVKHLKGQLGNAKAYINKTYQDIQNIGAKGLEFKGSENIAFVHGNSNLTAEQAATVKKYNEKILESIKLRKELGLIEDKEFRELETLVTKAIVRINAYNNALERTTQATNSSTTQAKTAIGRAVQDSKQGFKDTIEDAKLLGGEMKILGVKVGQAFSNIGRNIGRFLKGNWVFMLIALLTAAWRYGKKVREEMEAINGISKEYSDDTIKVKGTVESEASILRNNLKIVKDTRNSEQERLYALKEINKAMGLVGDKAYTLEQLDKVKGKYAEITKEVENWIEATKKQALVQHYANQIAEITAKKAEAKRKQDEAWATWSEWEAGGDVGVVEGSNAKKEWGRLNLEIIQLDKALKQAEADMYEAGIAMADLFSKFDKGNNKIDTLTELMSDYKRKCEELDNQLKEGALSQEDYNKAMADLSKKTFATAAGIGELSLAELIEKQDKNKSLTKLEEWYLELRETAIETAKQVVLDGIAKSLIKDIDDALAEEAKELEKEFKKILENEEQRTKVGIDFAGATSDLKVQNSLNKRDGTFDYKKTTAEILGEDVKIINENLDRVMDKIKALLDEEKKLMKNTGQGLDELAQMELDNLRAYYRELAAQAKTIEDAYRFEQIQQDIEEFQKSMWQTGISGIEDMATSLDRVVSGAKQLRELMEDMDTTSWEKIMGVVNYVFNILNAITSAIDTINTLTEISNSLGAAKSLLDDKKKVDAAVELESTASQIAAEQTLAGVKAQQVGFETTITANKIAQAEAALSVAAALGVETAAWIALAAAMKDAAIAAAAANVAAASGPAAPAAALAAAAEVGAGLTATMAAFAKGGIVGGNSTHGDRNIARVNSGEMILNKAQQGTLWGLLNGKGSVGGNVEFKIRGADLVGTINNYSKKISK